MCYLWVCGGVAELSGRLSRVGEDYRVGWVNMGGVTKDSYSSSISSKEYVRSYTHSSSHQPPATHQAHLG